MRKQQAKELIGKYGLFQVGDVVDDSVVTGVSPSGDFVQLGYGWHRVEAVAWLEELPEALKPRLTAAVPSTAVIAGSAVAAASLPDPLATEVEANQRLQEENASLKEQLSAEQALHARELFQARKEVEGLKAALAAEEGDTAKVPTASEPGTLTFPTGG